MAILIAAFGGPAVRPQAMLRDIGSEGTMYQRRAVATDDLIELRKDKVEGVVPAAGPMLVIDGNPDSNPTVARVTPRATAPRSAMSR